MYIYAFPLMSIGILNLYAQRIKTFLKQSVPYNFFRSLRKQKDV